MGSQIGQLFEENRTEALFVYSKNCHGCKKFLPIYEELARENLEKTQDDNFIFNRINNDENHSNLLQYMWSTPKILLFRNNDLATGDSLTDKKLIYEFRGNILNKQLMSDFFRISSQYSLIDGDFLSKLPDLSQTARLFTFSSSPDK